MKNFPHVILAATYSSSIQWSLSLLSLKNFSTQGRARRLPRYQIFNGQNPHSKMMTCRQRRLLSSLITEDMKDCFDVLSPVTCI